MTGYLVGTYTAIKAGKIIAGVLAERLAALDLCVGERRHGHLPSHWVLQQAPSNMVALLTAFEFLYTILCGVNAMYMTKSFATGIRATAVGGRAKSGGSEPLLRLSLWALKQNFTPLAPGTWQ